MKNYLYAVKALVAAWVCLLSISMMAQLRTPENVPITFYGKVVDQSGQPVEGVKISLLVVISHLEKYDAQTQPVTLETDQKGNFTLNGYIAYGINIVSIEKDGYELSKKVILSYNFGLVPTYTPDRNNPVVFRMWKRGKSEPLVGASKSYKITPDGRPFTIDLLKHEEKPGISPLGDIIVRINRPEKLAPGKKVDWSYSIEAIDGGIIHTNTDFLYQAPETGYEPKYEFFAPATNARWAGWAKEQFYIKSRSGQVYGSLEVEIDTDYDDHAVFKVDCALNPAGSRNLER